MKVILTTDVDKLGKSGELKEVTEGYARNFLLARKLAVPARRVVPTEPGSTTSPHARTSASASARRPRLRPSASRQRP